MSNIIDENNPRTVGEILLSLEEKVDFLIKINASGDMLNKLILDRLNKIAAGNINLSTILPATQDQEKIAITATKDFVASPIPSQMSRANRPVTAKTKDSVSEETNKNLAKIAVGQRIKDTEGKDFFFMDVTITNLSDGTVTKVVTNPVGKWQTQLSPGKYQLKLFSNSANPPEYFDEFEITNTMKSLQLPVAIIKR